MKLKNSCFLVLLMGTAATLSLCACNGTVPLQQQVPAARSILCPNVSGLEAIAWDYYNGVIRADPIGRPPAPAGAFYSHPDFPLLGFSYSPDWTPLEVRDGVSEGVTLIRNDNQALWRLVFSTVNGTPNVRAVRDLEIQQILDFYGFAGQAGQVQTVCLNEGSAEQAPGVGIFTSASNIMIRTPGHTAFVNIQVTPFPAGLNMSSITTRAMAAPTAEFPARAYDSFMAIDWQMILGDITNQIDRDRDGWLDEFDRFPDDPNLH